MYLTLSTLLDNSAHEKLIFFLFFPENRISHFMQIVSIPIIYILKTENSDDFMFYVPFSTN